MHVALYKWKHEKRTTPRTHCEYVALASYADALWARQPIFLLHERLLKQTAHSFPFVRKDQLETTWKLL
jgi:hypothetical protein